MKGRTALDAVELLGVGGALSRVQDRVLDVEHLAGLAHPEDHVKVVPARTWFGVQPVPRRWDPVDVQRTASPQSHGAFRVPCRERPYIAWQRTAPTCLVTQ